MKIFCVGRNYVDHTKELNNPIPTKPLIFMKPDTALVKGAKTFYIPSFSSDVHYECEIVLKISRPGKTISPEYALDFIDKITLGLDFTARDIQSTCKSKGHPWELAKAFDYSAPIGEFQNFENFRNEDISFHLNKNGKTVQKGSSSQMIFSFIDVICYISQFFTLKAGDLIFTGTPAGVGPVQGGDILEGYLMNKKILQSIIK